jgi:outer membrane protein assembly factor BamB
MVLVNGYVYFCDNNQGKLYRLNPSNFKVEQLAASIFSGTNYAFADSTNVYFTSSNGWICTLPL